MLKLSTIFVFIFFTFLVAPSYIMAAAPLHTSAAILLCGIAPLVYVTYSASPFVTAIQLHIPPFARTSTEMLRRFAANAPPTTQLEIITQSMIGKPRVSSMKLGDLKPANKRFGMVNFERDTTIANKERKWYHFRAIGNFNVQKGNEGKIKHGWVWPEIAKTITKRHDAKP
ncbi:hypothetical protein B0T16DRAFT_59401 [Cercophora newfieldiana]|uniref:Uncharacterized protein n=1 Tax=Cercophora newfieldiana TaxID=92897 RepID=A0AA39YRM4_9PEZI|nr:hypothetical protein B0T16DRAFT_59401 [Cercophora newfieldiana]